MHVRFQGCNGIQIAQDEEEIGHTQIDNSFCYQLFGGGRRCQ